MFYPHAIILANGDVISQLTDLTPAYNFTDLAERTPSDVGPTFTGTGQSTPEIPFGTTAIKTVLDHCTELAVCGSEAAGNVDIEYRAGVNRGTRESEGDAEHLRLRAEQNAYLSWQSLRVEQGGNAEIRSRLVPVFDGVNDPLVPTSGVTISTTSSISQLYTLGPIKINGETLDLVQGAEWNNNLEYDEQLGDVGFFTWSGVRSMTPVITVRTRRTSYFSYYGTRGTQLASFAFYLRRRKKHNINEVNGQSLHILLSHTLGTVKARQINGTEAELSIHLEKASNVWFSKNTATTIS